MGFAKTALENAISYQPWNESIQTYELKNLAVILAKEGNLQESNRIRSILSRLEEEDRR